MTRLSDDQVKAVTCLREGSLLIDPKHMAAHLDMEAKLRERCRACYAMREFWPQWVKDYAAKWAKEKAKA